MISKRSKSPTAYQPTEEQDCYALAGYLRILQTQGKIQMFTHIPNSTYTTSIKTKVRNKNLGVSRGVPDYMILTNKEVLFIEMKRKFGGVVSPEQLAWIKALSGLGYPATVCEGFDEAKALLDTL
jgi:hypothetical protein